MSEHQIDHVTQRLDRLERENWYWKRATILLLIFISLTLLMGQGPVNWPRVIEAERFVLKDRDGNIRGVWGQAFISNTPSDRAVFGGNYGLHLYDGEKRYLVGLYYQDEGLADKQIRGTLELRAKNTPTSSTLEVSDWGVFFKLHATQLPTEVWHREREEWSKRYNAAKTQEERERLGEIPYHGVQAWLAAARDLAELHL